MAQHFVPLFCMFTIDLAQQEHFLLNNAFICSKMQHIIASYFDYNIRTLSYSSAFLTSMAQVVNIMIWLFFQPRYSRMHIVRRILIMRFSALDVSFFAKMPDHVLTGFISSNLKSCEDKECDRTNEHQKPVVFFIEK